MSVFAVLGWISGLWVAAGLEAAWGGGMPGPLLLVALVAGLWSGPQTGMLVGTAAGLCDAALFGQPLLLCGLIGLGAGAGAGLLTQSFSRRHLLLASMSALVASLLSSLLLGWSAYHYPEEAAVAALRRGGENFLCMIAIYGILLLVNHSALPAMRRE